MMGMFVRPQLNNRFAGQTIVALLVSLAISAVAVMACGREVFVTVEVTREVPVTREVFVTFEVPVTRLVEVTPQFGRLERDTVGTAAAVKACSAVGELLLTVMWSIDPSTGLPAMTDEEFGRSWAPIMADVYDSGDLELIRAFANLTATDADTSLAEAEELSYEVVLACSRFIER